MMTREEAKQDAETYLRGDAMTCTNRTGKGTYDGVVDDKVQAYIDDADVRRQIAEIGKHNDAVNNPSHYGGADNPYEAIKVIEAWELGFNLGNTVKYISRAGKKNPDATIEDLKKAAWYLARHIDNLENDR